jgi:hypothetical protein
MRRSDRAAALLERHSVTPGVERQMELSLQPTSISAWCKRSHVVKTTTRCRRFSGPRRDIRTLLLGGSALGSHVLEALLEHGYAVRMFSRRSDGAHS